MPIYLKYNIDDGSEPWVYKQRPNSSSSNNNNNKNNNKISSDMASVPDP